MLIHVPLESYQDRYTSQMSAPETGWMEAAWRAAGVPFRRIDGPSGKPDAVVQGSGPVLDTGRRGKFAFAQVAQLIDEVDAGIITDEDVIFLSDFWTPGLEQFFLGCDLKGVQPRVFAQLWAQSCDKYDFTHKSRPWIRHFERGLLERMAGVFVACPMLRTLVDSYGAPTAGVFRDKVYAVGLPFRSSDVRNHSLNGVPLPAGMRPEDHLSATKEDSKLVVWTSRLDREKNPYMFAEVARQVLTHYDPEVVFTVCTGQPELRGDQGQIDILRQVQRDFPSNIVFRTGLSKAQYYSILRMAKVQFNAASQDWVSFTLLEASAAGCYPVYPDYRSFPETFLNQQQFMYPMNDYEEAARMIAGAVNDDTLFTPDAIRKRAWIHERFDSTWMRQLQYMGLWNTKREDAIRTGLVPNWCADPFDIDHVRCQWPEAGL